MSEATNFCILTSKNRKPEKYKEIKELLRNHKDAKPINITYDKNLTKLQNIFQYEKIHKALKDNKNVTAIVFHCLNQEFKNDFFTTLIESIEKAFVIGVYSDSKILLLWKIENGKINQMEIVEGKMNFHNLQIKAVTEFIVEKLKDSVEKAFVNDDNTQEKSIEIQNIVLENEENLFTSAIKAEKIEVLKFLIRSEKYNINEKICYVKKACCREKTCSREEVSCREKIFITPIELSCSIHKPEVFLFLLENDSMFPEYFFSNSEFRIDMEKCKKVKNLIGKFEELHTILKRLDDFDNFESGGNLNNDKQRFNELFNECSNYVYCFNTENVSLVLHALQLKKFNLEKLFTKRSKKNGPHETEEYKKLSKKTVDDNINNARNLPNLHVEKLLLHTCLDNDSSKTMSDDKKNETETLRKVYEHLCKIDKVEPILKIIVASEKFKIIFDRNMSDLRDFLRLNNNNTYGAVFWKEGNITVSAKDLFHKDMVKKITTKKNSFENILDESVAKIIGTLSHEFCHYAFLLTFQNQCKPYAIDDGINFDGIIKSIHENVKSSKDLDDNERRIIASVFEYPENERPTELAVRPAQFHAEFSHKSEMLERYQINFSELFEFYDKFLEKVGETIETVEKLSDAEKTIAYEDLTDDLKISLQRSEINFQGNILKIIDILRSNVNEVLESNQLLDRDVEDILKKMNSTEIRETFNPNKKLKIGSEKIPPMFFVLKTNKNQDKIENYKIIFANVERSELNSLDCEKIEFSDYVNQTKRSSENYGLLRDAKTVYQHSHEFNSPHRVTKAHHQLPTDNDLIDKSFLENIKAVENDQILMIKGSGKTTLMKFFAALINKLRIKKWILEIDSEIFEIEKELEEINNLKSDELILKFISFVLKNVLKLDKNTFEAFIFKKLFEQGQVVIFWNDIMLVDIEAIVLAIKQSGNEQWIGLIESDEVEEFKILRVENFTGIDKMSYTGKHIFYKIAKITDEKKFVA